MNKVTSIPAWARSADKNSGGLYAIYLEYVYRLWFFQNFGVAAIIAPLLTNAITIGSCAKFPPSLPEPVVQIKNPADIRNISSKYVYRLWFFVEMSGRPPLFAPVVGKTDLLLVRGEIPLRPFQIH